MAVDTDMTAMASKRDSPHATYGLEKYKKKKQRNRNWAGEAAPQPSWLVCSSLWAQHPARQRGKKEEAIPVAHDCNPAEADAGDQGKLKVSLAYGEFQANQEYIARPCLKKQN